MILLLNQNYCDLKIEDNNKTERDLTNEKIQIVINHINERFNIITKDVNTLRCVTESK